MIGFPTAFAKLGLCRRVDRLSTPRTEAVHRALPRLRKCARTRPSRRPRTPQTAILFLRTNCRDPSHRSRTHRDRGGVRRCNCRDERRSAGPRRHRSRASLGLGVGWCRHHGGRRPRRRARVAHRETRRIPGCRSSGRRRPPRPCRTRGLPVGFSIHSKASVTFPLSNMGQLMLDESARLSCTNSSISSPLPNDVRSDLTRPPSWSLYST